MEKYGTIASVLLTKENNKKLKNRALLQLIRAKTM
jgi:hypothetical protein